jgi:hypothetical protein
VTTLLTNDPFVDYIYGDVLREKTSALEAWLGGERRSVLKLHRTGYLWLRRMTEPNLPPLDDALLAGKSYDATISGVELQDADGVLATWELDRHDDLHLGPGVRTLALGLVERVTYCKSTKQISFYHPHLASHNVALPFITIQFCST